MSICVELTRDSEETAMVGGKARSLLKLAAAGLPVPAAFAVTDALFRRLRAAGPALPPALRSAGDLRALDQARDALRDAPWPAGFIDELEQHLERLAPGETGARFSVRSSFLREDRAGTTGAGAGVYESRIGVARTDVPAAIRTVLASALSAGAVAYARAQGDDPEAQATAVLIHRTIDGEAAGSAAFDPDGGEPPAIEPTPLTTTLAMTAALGAEVRARAADQLRVLAARHGSIEVEWVSTGGQLTFLQLRPYLAPPKARAWAPAAALGDGAWRWDAAHNPLPLSPAQAGLVALVDEQCRIGLRQRVAGGYLFYAPDGPPPRETIDPAGVDDAFAALAATVGQRLSALGDTPALEPALALFTWFYDRLYGVIQPALRRAAADLDGFLRGGATDDRTPTPMPMPTTMPAFAAEPDFSPLVARLLAGVPSIAGERGRLAERLARARSPRAGESALSDYLARFGDEAPVWDVAVPTYREDPTRLLALRPPGGAGHGDQASDGDADGVADTPRAPPEAPAPDWRATAREIAARLPAAKAATLELLVERARRAAAIGEDDDALYAGVQAAVRAALRGVGGRLVATGRLADSDDIFWLPFDLVRRLAGGEAAPDVSVLVATVASARAAHLLALHEPPTGASGPAGGSARRGVGAVIPGRRASAGRIIGPAFVHRPARAHPAGELTETRLGPTSTSASIIVAATLLPTELPLLPAAGLVVESGGVLGHVAAQARERGIPALVEAQGASAAISDGDLLLLDADAGQVVLLAFHLA